MTPTAPMAGPRSLPQPHTPTVSFNQSIIQAWSSATQRTLPTNCNTSPPSPSLRQTLVAVLTVWFSLAVGLSGWCSFDQGHSKVTSHPVLHTPPFFFSIDLLLAPPYLDSLLTDLVMPLISLHSSFTSNPGLVVDPLPCRYRIGPPNNKGEQLPTQSADPHLCKVDLRNCEK
jgi:hypothetical protein